MKEKQHTRHGQNKMRHDIYKFEQNVGKFIQMRSWRLSRKKKERESHSPRQNQHAKDKVEQINKLKRCQNIGHGEKYRSLRIGIKEVVVPTQSVNAFLEDVN